MKIEDFYKPNKNIIDAEKFFKADGTVDEEKLEFLQEQKPIVTFPRDDKRFKYFSIKENRDRYEVFPDRLPTRNLLPQPVDAHEMIGQIETNQNLYLTIANAYNKAMEKIESLEARIKELENK
jgi:hypothetical protein